MKNILLLMLMGLFMFSFVSATLEDGLVSYWQFEEASAPLVDQQKIMNWSADGSPTYSNTGNVGSAIGFDSNSDFFDANTTPANLDFGLTEDFSFSIWINSSEHSTDRRIFEGHPSGITYDISTQADGGIGIFASAAGRLQLITTPTNDSVWHNIIFMRNNSGQDKHVYLDGVLVNYTVGGATTDANVDNMRLGDDRTDRYFNGLIDEFRIYNRTLTFGELAQLSELTTLNSPLNNSIQLANSSIDFNITYAADSLANISMVIDNVVNETKIVSGSTNTSVFSKIFSPTGIKNYYFEVCGTSSCYFSSNYTVNISTYSITSEVFDTTTTEVSPADFEINITTISGALFNTAKLYYDGTAYDGTINSLGGNAYQVTRTITTPGVTVDTNKSFYWNLTFTGTLGTVISETHNQTVTSISFSFCGAGETPFVTFDTKSASNPFPTVNATFKSAWEVSPVGGNTTTAFSYEDLTETNNTWSFCFTPNSTNYEVTATLEVDGTDFSPNFHYLVDAVLNISTETNITLYLLNDSMATLTELEVVDANLQSPIQDVYVTIQFFDVGTNTFYNVGMAKTSHLGTDLTYLNWYDSLYKFVGVKDGEVVFTTTPYKISATPQTFKVANNPIFPFTKFDNFEYSLLFNDTSNNFVLTFLKPSGDVDEACLNVIKRNITNDYPICDVCESSNSATLFCNIENQGNGTFIATFYATGSRKYVDVISTYLGIQNTIFEELGYESGTVLAIIFSGVIASFFFISPVLAVIGMVIAAVMSIALGFQALQMTTMAGIILIGGIVAWALKR